MHDRCAVRNLNDRRYLVARREVTAAASSGQRKLRRTVAKQPDLRRSGSGVEDEGLGEREAAAREAELEWCVGGLGATLAGDTLQLPPVREGSLTQNEDDEEMVATATTEVNKSD